MSEPRFYVQPPTGKAGSGHFCWWTVKDRDVDLTKHGNNITDYYFDGMPDAPAQAEARANALNTGTSRVEAYGLSHGGPV